MIKKFGDYDKVKGYAEYPTLPKGGYVLKVMGVSQQQNSNGPYLVIGCDIAEGEYKDFFSDQYRNDNRETKKWGCNYLLSLPKDDGTEKDGWTKRSFKTFTEALEDSNKDYHFDWDETKFKGKIIGGLFIIREYKKSDGSIGSTVSLKSVCAADKVRKGDYKLPDDKLLPKETTAAGVDGFISIPEGITEELPFN